ncbi:MAG: hypothetical protein EOR99_13040 [Mesorhizobium sp.]|uniref:hypothetical protein n=1 Tax=unclassified Mesorhizobium TaxID=325217 RepID=UPI000FC9BB72|nr:hypothetical protein [Mesorhizobium sp. M6A.T.Ce.TU.016.01.1.1]RUU31701.1 hypothetical protein EOC94_06150 [Mesorhizobium sp. M6A.T.Ce.TU.016.01.1.1]RWN66915.1 MAG: hypothetical protein EOR99_13040 [Mesorhizobium sp.]
MAALKIPNFFMVIFLHSRAAAPAAPLPEWAGEFHPSPSLSRRIGGTRLGLQRFCLTMIFFQKPVSTFWDHGPENAKAAPALFRPVAAFVDRTIPERSRARKPLAFPVRRAAWPYPACRVLVIVGETVLRGLVLAGPAVLRGLDLKRPCR